MRVVVPMLETVALFELAVPVGVFGAADRADLVPDWYELVVCGTGAHRASAGLTLSARAGLSALRPCFDY
jgi:hypothetical protein